MNNLRQQAARQQTGPAAAAAAAVAVAAAAASQPQSRENGSPVNMSMNGPGAPRIAQLQQQAQVQQNPQAQQQGQQGRTVRPVQPVMGAMQPYPQQVNGGAMSPSYVQQPANHNLIPTNGNGGPTNGAIQNMTQGRNSNALQDYQMQLMLLEKQNKKRLDIARGNGATDMNLAMQLSQQLQMQIKQQHPPKASPAPSPVQNNKPSPENNGAKSKKAPAAKRSRKSSVANPGSTPQNTFDVNQTHPNGRPAAGVPKKEYTTPLTPAAEVDSNKKKRKSTSGDSPKKQQKGTAAVKKEKQAPKAKKEENNNNGDVDIFDSGKLETDEDKMPPPSAGYFPGTLGANEKMITVDMLSGDASDGTFFAGDDFEFPFFDGSDGMGDSMPTFGWNNPIEGDRGA